jgi:hypothetical protein
MFGPQYNYRQPPRPQQQRPAWAGNQNQNQNQPQLLVTQLPNVNQVGTIVVNGVRQFAKRYKYITAWYVLGLIILCILVISGGKGRSLTIQEQKEYNYIMNSIDLQAEYDAVDAYWDASNRYHATKGWFTCDGLCQRNKQNMIIAEQKLRAIRAEGNARMSDAKAIAGLFSDVAFTEMYESFWQYLNAGKRFAKRQTSWDIMWMMMRGITRGRDESWIEYALKILLHILINFSIGLLSALVFFVFGLWNILRSYQPNPIVAIIVFIGAASAATSFVITYILGMFGAAATGIYGVAKIAENSLRAQIANEQQQRQQIQRPHHE